MKTRRRGARIPLVLWALAAMLVVMSCDEDPVNDDLTTVEVENATAAFAIEVADARTGEPLSGVPVTLRISGAAAPRVIDVVGSAVTQLTTESGFVALGLTGAVPTTAAPAELLVVAGAAGYLETSQRVVLTAESDDSHIIQMVSLASPPPGTAVGTSGAAVAGPGGVLAATVTVPTAADAVTGGRASVTLPAGAVVRDAAGSPLSGALQTTIVYFNNRSYESLTAFPGGFVARVENPPPGAPPEGVFTSGGYTAITVRDGAGREAKTFSAPIQVSVDVPAGTVNPETGVAVKNGDLVPSWSYEPRTGAWRYEGSSTLGSPNAAGNYTSTVAMHHLSYINLDWIQLGICAQARIYIVGSPPGKTLVIRLSSGGYAAKLNVSDGFIDVVRPPPTPVLIEAVDPATGQVVGSLLVPNLCGSAVKLTVTAPASASVLVGLRIRCGKLLLLPWGWIQYRKVGTRLWRWGAYLQAGEGVIRGLEPNTRYEVTAAGIYAGATFSGTSTVTTGANGSDTRITVEFGLDPSLCDRLRLHDQGRGP